MNPIVIVIAVLILSNKAEHPLSMPPYFDTFRMELFLDKLRVLTNSLEKINNVNQKSNNEGGKGFSVDRIHESLDAIKDLLADQKEGQQLNTISKSLAGLKQFGDIDSIISTLGPLLSLLSNSSKDEYE